MKKYYIILFWTIWLFLIAVGFYTISKTVVLSTVFSNFALTLNLFERVTGVLLFTLLFIQIVLGAFMDKLEGLLGSLVFKVHTFFGPVIYVIALIHPLFLFIFNFKIFHTFDPFYIYTQACLLCNKKIELFYSFGRIGLWLLTITVIAGLFRKTEGWLKKNWRKLHILNYLVFFLIAVHGYFIGSDFKVFPFNYFFYASIITVFITIILKIFKRI